MESKDEKEENESNDENKINDNSIEIISPSKYKNFYYKKK